MGELPEQDGHIANPEAGAEETRSEHIQPPTKRRKMHATSVQGSASPAVAELAKESLLWLRGKLLRSFVAKTEIDALVAGEASGANNASAEPQCDEREIARIETISGDPQLDASAAAAAAAAASATHRWPSHHKHVSGRGCLCEHLCFHGRC